MSRERSVGRPLAVWSAVTGATVAAAAVVPATWEQASRSSAASPVPDALVAVCAAALAVALARLWVVTSVVVAGLLRSSGAAGSATAGATRRLVLLACGAAVAAGTAVPAVAVDGGAAPDAGPDLLTGLALPERAVAPPRAAHPAHPPAHARPTTAARTHVVRPGESLWSIAARHPGVSWPAIWSANRGVVGDDPDLIHPGQALRLPAPVAAPDPEGEHP